jgi:predicted amidohydrolase YtcJ
MNTISSRRISRREFLKVSGVVVAGVLIPYRGVQASYPTADTVLTNGNILCVEPAGATAQAVAIRKGKILDVGENALASRYVGQGTEVVDLQGRTLTPGLIDAHAHLPFFGLRENGWLLNLQGIFSKDEILELLAQRAGKTPRGEWISAWGVENLSMSHLNREDLDRVSRSHPMLVVSTGGQWGFANSYALKIAGIDRDTPDPPGSRIARSPSTWEPSGLLVHYPALNLVRRHMPVPTEEQAGEALLFAARLYATEGVTTVHDNFFSLGTPCFQKAYFNLTASGKMPVRMKLWPYIPNAGIGSGVYKAIFQSDRLEPHWRIKDLIRYKRESPSLFEALWGGFKMAVDGGGPTTHWYDRPGLCLHSGDELYRMANLFHGAGHQVSIHAGGDHAVDMALDAIEAAQRERPREDSRHRIEHALSPRWDTLDRMKKLGIVVCTHPQWFYAWGDKWSGFKMRENAYGVIPLRSYLKRGIPVALGADPPAFPVYQPQVALWQASARITKGGYRFDPVEAISIDEALKAQTMGSAYAGFQEKEIGSIEKGKLADLVIWNKDFHSVPREEIKDVKAELTLLEGRIVYTRDGTTLFRPS